MKCEGLAAGFNILCNALTIPLWQALGACLSVLLTDLLRFFILLNYQRKAMGSTGPFLSSVYRGFAFSGGILFPLAWLHVPLFPAAGLLFLAYPPLVYLGGGLRKPASLSLVQKDENP